MTVQLQQVIDLERKVEVARQNCEAKGAFRVGPADVERLDQEIATQQEFIAQRFGNLAWLWWVPLAICTFRIISGRAVSASQSPLFAVSLLIAVLGLGISLAIGLVLNLSQVLTVISAIVIASAAGLGFAALLVGLDEATAQKKCLEILEWKGELEQRRSRINDLLRSRSELLELLRLRKSYDDLASQAATLRSQYETAANQLALVAWRPLRGIEFERFLAAVFQLHGFEVMLTKASGDQGIDLIASSPSLKLAIQAKGYEGSVGNDAVQEAFAGARHYERIHSCKFTHSVVITNSTFTKSARELAQSVECFLIDEQRMPDLIAGRIFSADGNSSLNLPFTTPLPAET
jgi:HJR/Mrr/RecB family endonuclease